MADKTQMVGIITLVVIPLLQRNILNLFSVLFFQTSRGFLCVDLKPRIGGKYSFDGIPFGLPTIFCSC